MISQRFSPDCDVPPSGRRGFVHEAPPIRTTFSLMALKANRKFVHQTKTISFTKFTFLRLFGWRFHFPENSTFVWNVSGNRSGLWVGSGRRRVPALHHRRTVTAVFPLSRTAKFYLQRRFEGVWFSVASRSYRRRHPAQPPTTNITD